MNNQTKTEREGTFGSSVLVLALAIAVLLTGVVGFKLDPHIPLLFSSSIILLYGVWLRAPWKDMRDSIIKSISESIEAILIICLIGMTVGSWISSGTVPMVIYYGLKIFSPQFFLISVLVLCSIMSIMTGSSWTTIGTIGVAFMGIGMGLGIPAPIVAGAVVCGSFFGDTQSPMSDGCNFATAISGAGLYNGVRGMIISNVPALLISIVAYVFIGMNYSHVSADSASGIAETLAGLEGAFNLTPAVLLPAALLIFLIVIKFPAVPTMIAAAFAGTLCAVLFQGEGLGAALGYMMKGYVGDTGVADVDKIVTRGGLSAMMSTVAIVILSMWMAGVLQRTGIMHAILAKIARIIRKPAGLVTTTTVMTYLFSYFAADPYLAMMLPSKAFAEAYDEMGYDRSVLCRSVSSAVFFAPMVPWGSGGLYVAATLGVAVLDYLPYYFVGFLAPIITILCAFTGWGMYKAKKAAPAESASN